MTDSYRHFRAILAWALVAVLTLGVAAAQTVDELADPDPEDWPTAGRTQDLQRFSPLDQITIDNVDQMGVAWVRALPSEGAMQDTPVVYDGVMYLNLGDGALALDATTGDQIWHYAPELHENSAGFFDTRKRGSVAIYDGKVFYNRADGIVVALDAETGEEVWSTPVGDIALSEGFTTGPIFADGKLLVGPSGADFGGHPGQLHALDAENGELLWTFDVVPGPEDEDAYATWDPKPTGEVGYGGGSMWNIGAYDEQTRTVVWGTGQPTPWDRYALRQGSKDLYTASFVALDIDTGEIKWHHQVVPADEWDYDQIVAPVVADIDFDGESRRVAMLTTTTGFLVNIDMETGEFVNAHNLVPGEGTVHKGYEADGTPIIDDSMRYDEPGVAKMVCPFRYGTQDLGSYSPETGLYYRPHSLQCFNLTTYPLEDDWQPGQAAFNADFPAVLDHYEYTGGLAAVDPATGEIAWQFTHGYDHHAGAVATAGGVVFGAFPDRTFRAFDAETGEVLWEQLVSSTTAANPIVYGVDGVEYVAITVGGTGGSGRPGLPPTVSGPPTVFVFALPASAR